MEQNNYFLVGRTCSQNTQQIFFFYFIELYLKRQEFHDGLRQQRQMG